MREADLMFVGDLDVSATVRSLVQHSKVVIAMSVEQHCCVSIIIIPVFMQIKLKIQRFLGNTYDIVTTAY